MQSKCDKPKNKQLSECCLLRKRDSINNKQLSKCCFLSRRHMTKNKQLSECCVWSKRDKTINKQLSQCYLLSKHDKVKNNHYFRWSFFKKKPTTDQNYCLNTSDRKGSSHEHWSSWQCPCGAECVDQVIECKSVWCRRHRQRAPISHPFPHPPTWSRRSVEMAHLCLSLVFGYGTLPGDKALDTTARRSHITQ